MNDPREHEGLWGGSGPARESRHIPGFDVFVRSRPSDGREGGDLRLVGAGPSGQFSRVVLADVAGHGPGSAEIAASLRALVRKHIAVADQTRLARRVNREFAHAAQEGTFATAILATYFPPTDHLIVCNAGHPRPLWFRALEGRWLLLDPASAGVASDEADPHALNLPLGIEGPTRYEQFAASLGRDDVIVFYTDGVMESSGGGEAVLASRLTHEDARRPEFLADRLVEGASSKDDATVIVLRHTADNPPAMSMAERVKLLGRLLGMVRE